MTPAEHQKQIRRKRKSVGMCTACGQATPVTGQVKCAICKHKDTRYRTAHKPEISISSAKRNINMRDAAIMAYGGYVCKCCGETEPMFLTLDHVNNDGADHRRELGQQGGPAFYKWPRDHQYPIGFQVLCMNCNFGKQRNGGCCPHSKVIKLTLVS